MSLTHLSYSEFEGDPRAWTLETLDFARENLVVGRNATGKSRLINVITTLMRILAGTHTASLSTGNFSAEFRIAENSYKYTVLFQSGTSIRETLLVNNELRMNRDETGQGKIFYEKEGKFLEFWVPNNAIAFQAKRDRAQHPFIVELSDWASTSATYQFGSNFGKNTLQIANLQPTANSETTNQSKEDDPNNVLNTYIDGFGAYKEAFDQALIEDMAKIGYKLKEVHAAPLDPSIASSPNGALFTTLTVLEQDVSTYISQLFMSQGMYRALALCIKLNWIVFSGRRGLLLIDDIGEGLDYERACSAVELALSKSKNGDFQLILSSNDRFVMNAVSLEKWIVLHRTGSTVKGFTSRNSPEEFESFRFTGLSNFDFFTSNNLQ